MLKTHREDVADSFGVEKDNELVIGVANGDHFYATGSFQVIVDMIDAGKPVLVFNCERQLGGHFSPTANSEHLEWFNPNHVVSIGDARP
ncbi:MAG: hypothetical protein AB7O61_24840 [Acidimicrobiia bacterium]